jgi:hypothetical protein
LRKKNRAIDNRESKIEKNGNRLSIAVDFRLSIITVAGRRRRVTPGAPVFFAQSAKKQSNEQFVVRDA